MLPFVIVFVLVVVAVVLAALSGSLDAKSGVGLIFPLAGTFVGAFLAFRVEAMKEAARVAQQQAAALNHALIVMMGHINTLLLVERHMGALGDDHDEHDVLSAPVLSPPSELDMRQKAEDLAFLVKHDANLILDVIVEQQRYDTCVDVLKRREEFMLSVIQPIVEKHQINGKRRGEVDLHAVFGVRYHGMLVRYTEAVYEHIPAATADLKQLIPRVHKMAKGLFPSTVFVSGDFTPQTPPSNSA